jgi:acyl-CoA thioester hydrolase
MSLFRWHARVYWEDTDAGGVVYYANYLRFLERARSEWLRGRGVSQRALAQDPGIVFAVVGLELQYLRPARLDDLLAISCEPEPAAGARLAFRQRVWRDDEHGELLLEAAVRIACLDAQHLKPRRVPKVLAGDPAGSP